MKLAVNLLFQAGEKPYLSTIAPGYRVTAAGLVLLVVLMKKGMLWLAQDI